MKKTFVLRQPKKRRKKYFDALAINHRHTAASGKQTGRIVLPSNMGKSQTLGQSNNTASKAFALHTFDPSSLFSSPNGPQSTARSAP